MRRASRDSALAISTIWRRATLSDADTGSRVQVQTEPLGDDEGVLGQTTLVDQAARRGRQTTHVDVLGHAEVRRERRLLVDHGQTAPDHVLWAAGLDGFTIDEDLARVAGVGARQDLHQGRLAGAVLADEPDDLARVGRSGRPT